MAAPKDQSSHGERWLKLGSFSEFVLETFFQKALHGEGFAAEVVFDKIVGIVDAWMDDAMDVMMDVVMDVVMA